ncbi:hypothetical protein BH23VER1_BH23VER1_36760 [soil metagenome]
MYSDDDIQYALETTRVIREPDRRIDTFGSTSFEFHLVSELMDRVGTVRIRNGKIEAARPTIIRPDCNPDLSFEGFGDQADAFATWFRKNVAVLQYPINLRKADVTETIVHDPFVEVCGRIAAEVEAAGEPLTAVIQGVDDAWEMCLLKFTLEMVEKSRGTNIFDFKRRGLL